MKLKSIWMHAWDLEGVAPEELIASLQDSGLNACNLAFSYHGGRMLLARHPYRKVYEQDSSMLYFPADRARYCGLRLQPHIAPQAELVLPFVEAARAAEFEVNAWTVLCHNDRLGEAATAQTSAQISECCVENVFGERYSYALCPSNPEVRKYITTLCADITAMPGVARLDMEALSFLGYDHASLHDKRGVPLAPIITWLLSICACADCVRKLGAAAEEIVGKARVYICDYLARFPHHLTPPDLRAGLEQVLGEAALTALLAMRARVVTSLLEEVRAAVGTAHLNLRLATSPLFIGGKSALDWAQLAGRADSATITFLGESQEQMAAELKRILPREQRSVLVFGGFCYHHPDCSSAAEVQARFTLLREAQLDGVIFYCYGMATARHYAWLKDTLMEE